MVRPRLGIGLGLGLGRALGSGVAAHSVSGKVHINKLVLLKVQIGFAFLVPAHPGSPGHRAVKRVCVLLKVHITSTHGTSRGPSAIRDCEKPRSPDKVQSNKQRHLRSVRVRRRSRRTLYIVKTRSQHMN